MGFAQVYEQYFQHIAKLTKRTPGPILNPKRAKVAAHCTDAMLKIHAIQDNSLTSPTREGFVMRTDAQLESGKGWAK